MSHPGAVNDLQPLSPVYASWVEKDMTVTVTFTIYRRLIIIIEDFNLN